MECSAEKSDSVAAEKPRKAWPSERKFPTALLFGFTGSHIEKEETVACGSESARVRECVRSVQKTPLGIVCEASSHRHGDPKHGGRIKSKKKQIKRGNTCSNYFCTAGSTLNIQIWLSSNLLYFLCY